MTEEAPPTRIWTTDTLQRAEMYVTTKPVEGGDEYVHKDEVERLMQLAQAGGIDWVVEKIEQRASQCGDGDLFDLADLWKSTATAIREAVKKK